MNTQQTTTTTTSTTAPLAGAAPQVIQHSAAIKETVKPVQIEEIQPIVNRQIERTEVHQITQPIYEKNVLPTQVQERVLPTATKAPVVLGGAAPVMAQEQSTRVVQNTQSSTLVKPALIQEQVQTHIVNEVQPVVYREVVAPSIIKEVQPISERIVEAPIVTSEVRAPIYSQGTSAPLAGQSSMMGQQPLGGFGLQQAGIAAAPHHYAPAGIFGSGFGLKGEEKALRYDNKADEWQRVGNTQKAMQNRQKAQKIRAKLNSSQPQTVRTPGGQLSEKQMNKIQRLETRALQSEQSNKTAKAIRSREKANHIRMKSGVPTKAYPGQLEAQQTATTATI